LEGLRERASGGLRRERASEGSRRRGSEGLPEGVSEGLREGLGMARRLSRRGSFSPQLVGGSPEYAFRRSARGGSMGLGDPFDRALSPPRGLYSPPRVRPVPAPDKLPSPAGWRAFSNPLANCKFSPPDPRGPDSGFANGARLKDEDGPAQAPSLLGVNRGAGEQQPVDKIDTNEKDREMTEASTILKRNRFASHSEASREASEVLQKGRPHAFAVARGLGFEAALNGPAGRRQRGRWSTPAGVLLPSFNVVADNDLFSEDSSTSLAEPEILEL
jgi:hypothetical protein